MDSAHDPALETADWLFGMINYARTCYSGSPGSRPGLHAVCVSEEVMLDLNLFTMSMGTLQQGEWVTHALGLRLVSMDDFEPRQLMFLTRDEYDHNIETGAIVESEGRRGV